MKKNHNSELLLLGLLFLAFLGKGPLAGPLPKPSPDPTRPGTPDMMPTDMTGKSGAPGENGSPTDMGGVTTKNAPPADTQNMPGGGSGVPDKSKMQTPPPNMPPMMTPPFMMPSTADLINPLPPKGGSVLPSGNVFVPGLDIFGNPTGGPGPGATTPSITTVYGMTTYTNFNPQLFTSKNMDEVLTPDLIKQPVPPPSIPMLLPIAVPDLPVYPKTFMDTSFGMNVGPTPTPLPATLPPMMQQLMQQILPPGNPMVPNPLPKTPDLISMLLQQAGGFGQGALNGLLAQGMNLTGLFSNLSGIFAPGGFNVPRIAADPFVV